MTDKAKTNAIREGWKHTFAWTPEWADAARKSIDEKWIPIRRGEAVNSGSDNCALCLYSREVSNDKCVPGSVDCEVCPVYAKTGLTQCKGTPYIEFQARFGFYSRKSIGMRSGVEWTARWDKIADAEIEFLTALIPPIVVTATKAPLQEYPHLVHHNATGSMAIAIDADTGVVIKQGNRANPAPVGACITFQHHPGYRPWTGELTFRSSIDGLSAISSPDPDDMVLVHRKNVERLIRLLHTTGESVATDIKDITKDMKALLP